MSWWTGNLSPVLSSVLIRNSCLVKVTRLNGGTCFAPFFTPEHLILLPEFSFRKRIKEGILAVVHSPYRSSIDDEVLSGDI